MPPKVKEAYDIIVEVWLGEHRVIPAKELAKRMGIGIPTAVDKINWLKVQGYVDSWNYPEKGSSAPPHHIPLEYACDVPLPEITEDMYDVELFKLACIGTERLMKQEARRIKARDRARAMRAAKAAGKEYKPE